MNCTQKQQLVSFPKVRIWKSWFRYFNNHKEFRNEGTVHLFSLMALFSYANFRSNERVINGERYMEAPGQWICKLGSLPRILRVHSKRQALEQLDYYEKYGFLTYEWLDEENEIIRFSITNWKEHCTSLQYNYYSYKGSGFFFFPLPVGRMLLRVALKTDGIVFSELDAIMDMWLHTILNDPKVRGSEYSPLMFWCPRTNGYWSPDSLRHLHKQMLAAAGVDESVRFHDLRHTFSTLAIQSGVDAKTVAGMLGHYSAAFTLDTYTHVTEQMKRGAAEKIGVFMNASVNVQVNVVHSPSAVVRGDYESDLANCLNPSNSTDLDPTSQ